jgi:signal transduction histidine kinase
LPPLELSHAVAVAPGTRPAGAVALARQLHDTVAQRLAGLSLLLAAVHPEDERLDRCRDEVAAALAELRSALETSVADADPPPPGLDAELLALRREHPLVRIRWSGAEGLRAGAAGGLVDTFLGEGIRNARRHARPSEVRIDRVADDALLRITVRNDGVLPERRVSCGMGLRLLETEAAIAGGLIDSGPSDEEGWWQLRLILPATS